MARPTTAIQIEIMLAAWRRDIERNRDEIYRIFFPPLFDRITRLVVRRRPRTDDMMQMCDDLGVDVPDRNYTSPDGLTFYF